MARASLGGALYDNHVLFYSSHFLGRLYETFRQAFEAIEKTAVMAKLAARLSVLIILALIVYLPTAEIAAAVSVELAKQCRAMAIKAHPPQKPGSKLTGTETAQRQYFSECIAKDGKMGN